MIFVYIYLIGYVFAYYIVRRELRKYKYYNWNDVGAVVICGFFSWLVVIVYLCDRYDILLPKPLNWL